jgi:hypothetical protein
MMIADGCIDMRGGDVQIEVSDNFKTIWVNVDGVCRLRISKPEGLEIITPNSYFIIREED